MGYPSVADERRLLEHRLDRGADETTLEPVVDRVGLIQLQDAIEDVHVSSAVTGYIVAVVTATRQSPSVQVGASPRGTLALMKLARVKAMLDGRDFVIPDDVKGVAVPALAHRLALKPELWVQQVDAEHVVEQCLAEVSVPVAEFQRS
jgi:MoxR-like ATPase